MADKRVIKEARIVPDLNQRTVYVVYTDGSEDILFAYYPDQMTFISAEFIGLTNEQAQNLFKKRDDLFHAGV